MSGRGEEKEPKMIPQSPCQDNPVLNEKDRRKCVFAGDRKVGVKRGAVGMNGQGKVSLIRGE